MDIDVIKHDVPLPGRRRPGYVAIAVLVGALLVFLLTLAGALAVVFGDSGPGTDSDTSVIARKPPQRDAALIKAVSVWTATDPRQLRPVSAQDAQRLNSAVPVANGANPPATPLALPAGGGMNLAAGLDCMTSAIYYEAATEPLQGQQAVAQVILNRVRHPAYPQTVCGVVYQGVEKGVSCQFSFVCDGSLLRRPMPALWQRARQVAAAALSGAVYAPVGWATHYHADYVFPYWAPTLVKSTVIGRHIFYRMPGSLGTSRAFKAAYIADEWRDMQRGQQQERVLLANIVAAPPEGALAGQPLAGPAPTGRAILAPNGGYVAPGDVAQAPAAPRPVALPAPDRYILGKDGGSLN